MKHINQLKRRNALIMLKRSIIILLLVTTLSLSPSEVAACSCAPIQSEEAFNRSDAVFTAKVIQLHHMNQGEIRSSVDPVYVELHTDQVWKGYVYNHTYVKTVVSSASCGYPFLTGYSYLIFASENNGELSTNLCSGTDALSEAEDALDVLGAGTEPLERAEVLQLPLSETKRWPSVVALITIVLIASTLVLLVVTSIVYLAWKRQQANQKNF
jgi:hypothetical protein